MLHLLIIIFLIIGIGFFALNIFSNINLIVFVFIAIAIYLFASIPYIKLMLALIASILFIYMLIDARIKYNIRKTIENSSIDSVRVFSDDEKTQMLAFRDMHPLVKVDVYPNHFEIFLNEFNWLEQKLGRTPTLDDQVAILKSLN